MSIKQHYQQALAQGLRADHEQEKVVHALEHLQRQIAQNKPLWQRWFSRKQHQHGVYLWGTVGIGKSMLMDWFFATTQTDKKRRWHFHEFMRFIHQKLAELQGKTNPLRLLAKQVADEYRVICLDEFFVDDIGDAMIFAEFFQELLQHDISLVTTSNCAPDDLYQLGFQRERFLPVIALLKKQLKIMHVRTDTDYRREYWQEAGVYYTPLDATAEQKLQQAFDCLKKNGVNESHTLSINDRDIHAKYLSERTAWFSFSELCEGNRSQQDYLELAQQFDHFLLEGVPKLSDKQGNPLLRFIWLIDVLYDQHRQLVISAASAPDQLYQGTRQRRAFERTASRLMEMQTEAYIEQAEA